ncbi:hypothetical protein [Candidatus Harpocratesius sp.]
MTVEIDDSGTGDLIGPAFILFWRRETNTLVKKRVPLELYQNKNFNNLTKSFIRNLFISTFQEMKIPQSEDIWLCTGPCFDEARKWLKENNYNYHDAKIEGYLQNQVESTYINYIIENYDFPRDKASIESGKERFFTIFNWVVEDYPRRKIFVKSGFEKWQSKWNNEAESLWMKKMVSEGNHINNNIKSSADNNNIVKTKSSHSKSVNTIENIDLNINNIKNNKEIKKTQQKKSKKTSKKSVKKKHVKHRNFKKKKKSFQKKKSKHPKYSTKNVDPYQKFY